MNQVRKLVPGWFAAMIAASAAICVIGLSQPQAPAPEKPALSQSEVKPVNTRELLDVLWLDRYPEMASDTFKAYTFTADNVGIAMDFHSAYKLTLELFEFKANNSNITFHFPHDGRRGTNGYKIEKMKKPTKHFDIQLTLENDPSNGGKTTVYFSGPSFRSLHNLPSPLRETLENSGALDRLQEDADDR